MSGVTITLILSTILSSVVSTTYTWSIPTTEAYPSESFGSLSKPLCIKILKIVLNWFNELIKILTCPENSTPGPITCPAGFELDLYTKKCIPNTTVPTITTPCPPGSGLDSMGNCVTTTVITTCPDDLILYADGHCGCRPGTLGEGNCNFTTTQPCPEGQQLESGVCIPVTSTPNSTCLEGTNPDGSCGTTNTPTSSSTPITCHGMLVPDPITNECVCPPGTIYDGMRTCLSTSTESSTETPTLTTCPDYSYYDSYNQECVYPSSEAPSPTTTLITCPEMLVPDPNTQKCVCPQGTIYVGMGKCFTCPSDSYADQATNECVTTTLSPRTCPEGSFDDGQQCITPSTPICSDEQIYDEWLQQCIDTPTSSDFTTESVTSDTPTSSDFTLSTCSYTYILDPITNECVCPPGTTDLGMGMCFSTTTESTLLPVTPSRHPDHDHHHHHG